MLNRILKAIVEGILGFISAWWEREKRVEAEWLAASREGQLESLKKTMDLEHKIEAAVRTVEIVSPAEWNK